VDVAVAGSLSVSGLEAAAMGSSMISGGGGGDEDIVSDVVVEMAIFSIVVVELREGSVAFEFLLEAMRRTRTGI
jgi:hypothetical protein